MIKLHIWDKAQLGSEFKFRHAESLASLQSHIPCLTVNFIHSPSQDVPVTTRTRTYPQTHCRCTSKLGLPCGWVEGTYAA